MASTGLKIRGACENCHRRKIKCMIVPGSGACLNCTHNNAVCLFAPRNKPGRPRRASSQSARISSRTDWNVRSNFQQMSPVSDSTPDGALTDLPEMDQFEMDSWNSIDNPPSSYQDPGNFGYFAAFPSAQCPSLPCASDPGSAQQQVAISSGAAQIGSNGDDLGFMSTLHICKQLDDFSGRLGESTFDIFAQEQVLAMMSSICSAAASRAVTLSQNDNSSSALILAAILKVLEVLGLLLSRLMESHIATSGIELPMLLKRLDLPLLQAKVFLGQMRQEGGVLKARDLHDRIEMIIEKSCPVWRW